MNSKGGIMLYRLLKFFGLTKCRHENMVNREWRGSGGIFISESRCPDCGYYDKGHVHEC